jgi:hypothetical protein
VNPDRLAEAVHHAHREVALADELVHA